VVGCSTHTSSSSREKIEGGVRQALRERDKKNYQQTPPPRKRERKGKAPLIKRDEEFSLFT
jgi:hypothetical protein